MEIFDNFNIQLYLITYLVSGIPFGLVILKMIYGINLRDIGSGSIGATNVLRALQNIDPKKAKTIAIITALLDAFKGAIMILIARYIYDVDVDIQWALAVISVIGHCFSPYLLLEGGKGVATSMGVLLVMLPVEALVAFIVWFSVGKIFRVSSLASLLGLLGFLVAYYFLNPTLPVINTHAPVVIIAGIIVCKHIPNILRIIQGKERKIL